MPIPVEIMSQPPLNAKQAALHKPSIEVHIDGHYNSKVYTSGSPIAGHAVINTPRDVSYDVFEIVFTGIASTRLDFVQQFPTHSFRPFMKLRMPIPESDLPADNVFEGGATYVVPFNFVVPYQLTIGACTHNTESLAVREQHLRLPPTVGLWEDDDQSPEMAQVEYAIRARAVRKNGPGAGQTKLMEGSQMVKVLPAQAEDAPLDLTFRDERYTHSKKKTIRKSLFSGKTGKLTATAAQPRAIMLGPDGRNASESLARIALEFSPSSADTPVPKINSVSGKLQAVTFFAASPKDSLPNMGTRANYSTNPSLNYSTTTSLFNKSPGEISWSQRHISTARRDSGYSSIGIEGTASESDAEERGRRGSKAKATKSSAPPITHSASFDIPFTVPTSHKKLFLPTFHSCLISRTYTLQLTLSVGPTNTAISLAVPLQLGVERVFDPADGDLPSFESVLAQDAEDEVNEVFRPRLMSIPSPELQGNSALPGYSDIAGRTVTVA